MIHTRGIPWADCASLFSVYAVGYAGNVTLWWCPSFRWPFRTPRRRLTRFCIDRFLLPTPLILFVEAVVISVEILVTCSELSVTIAAVIFRRRPATHYYHHALVLLRVKLFFNVCSGSPDVTTWYNNAVQWCIDLQRFKAASISVSA